MYMFSDDWRQYYGPGMYPMPGAPTYPGGMPMPGGMGMPGGMPGGVAPGGAGMPMQTGPGQMGGPGYPGYPGGDTAYPGAHPGAGMPSVAHQVLNQIRPVVHYAITEQTVEKASPRHTLFEVAAIAYLMGRGMPFGQARQLVESWEIDEMFPGYGG